MSQISQIISVEKNLSCGEISTILNNLWSFIEIYAVFALNLCGENLCGEKITNMRSGYVRDSSSKDDVECQLTSFKAHKED